MLKCVRNKKLIKLNLQLKNSCKNINIQYTISMTKVDKLLKKFISKPKDFTYEELVQILKRFGYIELKTGKTSGSAVKFKNDSDNIIMFHKPHPGNIIKSYVIDKIIEKLERNGLI